MSLVRIVGVLALLVVVVALGLVIGQGQFEKTPKDVAEAQLPDGFRGRVLAMEFVSKTSDVDKILGPNVSHNREVMRRVLMIDFVWIACYGLLFVAISALLRRRRCPWARYLGYLALVAGVASAVFDVRENRRILAVMSNVPYDQTLINQVNDAALLKWTFGFVAIALLAIAFLDLGNRLANWISISFIGTAAIGFVGLWRYPLLPLVQIPLLIGLILLVIAAFARPQHLQESAF
jgi:hypothetical protein